MPEYYVTDGKGASARTEGPFEQIAAIGVAHQLSDAALQEGRNTSIWVTRGKPMQWRSPRDNVLSIDVYQGRVTVDEATWWDVVVPTVLEAVASYYNDRTQELATAALPGAIGGGLQMLHRNPDETANLVTGCAELCQEVVRGTSHELEHTDDWLQAMQIALDHLQERADYYEVLEAAMSAPELEPAMVPNYWTSAALLAVPIAVDQAIQHPQEADWIASRTVMPYYVGKQGYRGVRALQERFGHRHPEGQVEPNGIAGSVMAAVRALGPAARAAGPRLVRWVSAAYGWAKAGASRVQIVQWLRESELGNKLANAIADAVIAVIATETAEGIRTGGRRVVDKTIGRLEPVPDEPEDEDEPAPPPPRKSSWRDAKNEPTLKQNAAGRYYVWVAHPKTLEIVTTEGPYGPFALLNGKTYARIAATKGRMHRIVTYGRDPRSATFDVVRIYEAGTGKRIE